jgi:hypothetical protein
VLSEQSSNYPESMTGDEEVAVRASLGASALLELDSVDAEAATVRVRRLTADGRPVGVELAVEVGPVSVECVLDPAEAETLAARLAAAAGGSDDEE